MSCVLITTRSTKLAATETSLPVACAHVVCGGVTEHVAERLVFRHILAITPDHNREFRLVIDLLADLRQNDRVAVRDQRVAKLAEHDGLGRNGLAAFDGVVAIVQPDAEDLPRIVNRRHHLGPRDRNGDGVRIRGGRHASRSAHRRKVSTTHLLPLVGDAGADASAPSRGIHGWLVPTVIVFTR